MLYHKTLQPAINISEAHQILRKGTSFVQKNTKILQSRERNGLQEGDFAGTGKAVPEELRMMFHS